MSQNCGALTNARWSCCGLRNSDNLDTRFRPNPLLFTFSGLFLAQSSSGPSHFWFFRVFYCGLSIFLVSCPLEYKYSSCTYGYIRLVLDSSCCDSLGLLQRHLFLLLTWASIKAVNTGNISTIKSGLALS